MYQIQSVKEALSSVVINPAKARQYNCYSKTFTRFVSTICNKLDTVNKELTQLLEKQKQEEETTKAKL